VVNEAKRTQSISELSTPPVPKFSSGLTLSLSSLTVPDVARTHHGSHCIPFNFPLNFYKDMPVLVLLLYLYLGKEKLILGANSFGDRRNATAKTKCLSPTKGVNISDYVSLFHSKLSWFPRETSREPRVDKQSAALGWSSAAELGWAPGVATMQCCRETSLPRSSSSAKPSRAEGTACRQ